MGFESRKQAQIHTCLYQVMSKCAAYQRMRTSSGQMSWCKHRVQARQGSIWLRKCSLWTFYGYFSRVKNLPFLASSTYDPNLNTHVIRNRTRNFLLIERWNNCWSRSVHNEAYRRWWFSGHRKTYSLLRKHGRFCLEALAATFNIYCTETWQKGFRFRYKLQGIKTFRQKFP